MARPSKPWLDPQKGRYFVTIAGVRHNLGPDRDEAHAKFQSLMAGIPLPDRPLAVGEGPTFDRFVKEYLAALPLWAKASSVRTASFYLKAFVKVWDRRKAKMIGPADIKTAVEAHKGWAAGGQRFAYVRLSAAYNWAAREHPEWNLGNPARKLRWPAQKSRSMSAVPTPEEFEKLLANVRRTVRDLLVVIFETGARSGEMIRVAAKDYYKEGRVFVLEEHKSDETGDKRVIHLTPKACEIVDRLVVEYPTGPLFRTSRGKPYPSSRAFASTIRLARRRLGLPDTIVVHGLRHGFITDSLSAGVSDFVVSTLVGHRGTRVILENYSHVNQRSDVLRAALDKTRGGKTPE